MTDRSPSDASASDRIPCREMSLASRVEAILISTDRPLTDARLVDLLGLPKPKSAKTKTRSKAKAEDGDTDSTDDPGAHVRAAIEALNESYEQEGRAFRVERLAGGWQVLTRSEFGPLLARLHRDRQQSRLSPAAMETLSIIAYRQPMLRAEIEAIRGVACGEVLRGLLERRLVKIVGRADELGRPMLYGTTKEFLTVFGLSGLNDLPEVEGLVRERSHRPASKAAPSKDDEATNQDAGANDETTGDDADATADAVTDEAPGATSNADAPEIVVPPAVDAPASS